MGNQQGKACGGTIVPVKATEAQPVFQLEVENTSPVIKKNTTVAAEPTAVTQAAVVLDDILTVDVLSELRIQDMTIVEELVNAAEHTSNIMWDLQCRYLKALLHEYYPCASGFLQTRCAALQPQPKLLLLIIDGVVYDATAMAPTHKAGAKIIARNANGKDCGATFRRIHGPRAHEQLRDIRLGHLIDTSSSTDEHLAPGVSATAAAKSKTTESQDAPGFTVIATEQVTSNTRNITFGSPTRLQLPPGGHVTITHGDACRNYTPHTVNDTAFTVMVKQYPGGKLSTYLHRVTAGQFVAVSPPLEPEVTVDDLIRAATEGHAGTASPATLVMVAGGTGVAPLYSMLHHLVDQNTQKMSSTQPLHVVFFACFRDEADALLTQELASLVERQNALVRVDLYFVFSRSDLGRYLNHSAFSGRFCEAHLSQTVQGVSAAVVCGPPGFGETVRDVLCSAKSLQKVPDAKQVFIL